MHIVVYITNWLERHQPMATNPLTITEAAKPRLLSKL
jgi:hypothetical protein